MPPEKESEINYTLAVKTIADLGSELEDYFHIQVKVLQSIKGLKIDNLTFEKTLESSLLQNGKDWEEIQELKLNLGSTIERIKNLEDIVNCLHTEIAYTKDGLRLKVDLL